jgi:ammonia channel protein AmtB
MMGMRDFGSGQAVHAAAGAAGLEILSVIWLEETDVETKTYREISRL